MEKSGKEVAKKGLVLALVLVLLFALVSYFFNAFLPAAVLGALTGENVLFSPPQGEVSFNDCTPGKYCDDNLVVYKGTDCNIEILDECESWETCSNGACKAS